MNNKRRKARHIKPLWDILATLVLTCAFLLGWSYDLEDGRISGTSISLARGAVDDSLAAELVRDKRIENYYDYQEYLEAMSIAAAEEQRRLEEEARLAAEAEQKRLEEERRLAAEAERKRLEEERRLAGLAAEAELAEHKQAVSDYVAAVVKGDEVSDAVNGNVFRRNKGLKGKVGLSFDDGPYKNHTYKYLDILSEYGVKATFFCQGMSVERYPEQTQAIVDAGCEVGCHSYDHGVLTKKSSANLREELELCKEIFDPIQPTQLFRFPYGSYNDRVSSIVKEYGMLAVQWSVDPEDWNTSDVDKLVDKVVNVAKEGDIILLHDGRDVTLAALPRILAGLRDKGLQVVTVSELLYGDKGEEATAQQDNEQ